MELAIVGLGRMGGNMARRLHNAGHRVIAYNRSFEKTQEIMAETYIEAARAIGASPLQIIAWHVLRNMAGPVIVYVSFAMGTSLLIEAILSFIGLGVQPPAAGW